MDVQLIFKLIVAFIVGEYIIERILGYLNTTYWSNNLPDELIGIYDEAEYKKSQNYEKAKRNFSLISSTFSLAIILIMLFVDGFAFVDEWARGVNEHPIILALLFFGLLTFGMDLLGIPFDLYQTFVIEEKFGFNKTNPKTFILDKLKSWLLTVIIGGGLLSLVVWIYMISVNYFWIIVWAVISIFMIFMAMFYSTIIVPLFNKQSPLEDGELRTAIEDFATKVGFRLKNIFVIDGSKRSTKANAYFSGLGPKKRIVLYDTLINDHSVEELVAVLAHEIGHYKKKHTLSGLALSVLQTGLMLFIMSFFIGNPLLSAALGAKEASFHLGILTFGILYTPISLILGLFTNMLSRKNEFAADNYAKENYDGASLALALKKLSVNNLSNLRPHPAYVFFYYSHPPLLERLGNIGK